MTTGTFFKPALFTFLEDLRAHNDRAWFEDHKGDYERDVREPALAFIEAMGPRLAAISPELTASAKKVGGSMMRVHRDVRFSADKSPYKTNLGIQFRHSAGKDVHAPGLYVHVEPGEAFMAAGLWHPDKEPLAAIRRAIAADPDGWLAARDDPAFAAAWRLGGEQAKRAPAGVDPAHPLLDDLRRKDFIAVAQLAPKDVLSPGFPDRAAERFAAATPFMRFLCEAVGLRY
jgi:uncharacterized protein (TIGR02453 family)